MRHDADMGRRFVRRIIPWAALLLLVAALALLVWSIDRYGPIDPTEPGWDANVVNDQSRTVTVESSAEKLSIPAGEAKCSWLRVPGRRGSALCSLPRGRPDAA